MKKQLCMILRFLIQLSLLTWLGMGTLARPALAQEPEPNTTLYLPMVVNRPANNPPPGNVPTITAFTANPASIAAGGTSTLSWNVTGATSLSLSPGIGPVTGSSRVVSPTVTTEYILTATNAQGSVSATTTITVTGAPTSGSFFLPGIPDIKRPTTNPTVVVDAVGGVHVAFAADTTTPEDATRPAYYAYCPQQCTNAAAFTIVPLGDHVDYAHLALDLLGRPRLLLRLHSLTTDLFTYQYGICEGICTDPANWTFTSILETHPRPLASGEPFSRLFALDHLGRPRFVYYDNGADDQDSHWGAFYVYCDNDCNNAANWQELRLLADGRATGFDLVFSPTGQPRLAYLSYDADNFKWYVAYAECNDDCTNIANWSNIRLVDSVSASVSEYARFAMRADSQGRPHMALYTGSGEGSSLEANYLHYLRCQADSCTQPGTWQAVNIGLPFANGEGGIDLALDSQDRPRIAYHAPLADGYGLYYTWCDSNCVTSAEGWQSGRVEPSERVTDELLIPPWPGCPFPQCNPPTPPCTLSVWDTGVRPSLALDAAGNPRIAYDADHEQGGSCGTFTDTRLTRFALFNQP